MLTALALLPLIAGSTLPRTKRAPVVDLLPDFSGCGSNTAFVQGVNKQTCGAGGIGGATWDIVVTPSDSQTGCLLTSSNDTETVAGVTSTALIILDVLSTGPGNCLVTAQTSPLALPSTKAGSQYTVAAVAGGDDDFEKTFSTFTFGGVTQSLDKNGDGSFISYDGTNNVFSFKLEADTSCVGTPASTNLNSNRCTAARAAVVLFEGDVTSSPTTSSSSAASTSTSSSSTSTSGSTSTSSTSKVTPTPSKGSQRKRRTAAQQQEALLLAQNPNCPPETRQCPIVSGAADAFECVETEHELNSCGGCIADGTGVDCEALPYIAVNGVSCQSGLCHIHECAAGFATNGTHCSAI